MRAWLDAAGITSGAVFRTFSKTRVLQTNRIDGADVARLVKRVTGQFGIAIVVAILNQPLGDPAALWADAHASAKRDLLGYLDASITDATFTRQNAMKLHA